ncbi:hypothetical protein Tco_0681791 [Tanacetum coccineum]|uniref:Uncharacterized protein n=1 Tax=Tanacetum coccineum TaxID=301880 RepID=A0ABQ4XQY8_9ASTR
MPQMSKISQTWMEFCAFISCVIFLTLTNVTSGDKVMGILIVDGGPIELNQDFLLAVKDHPEIVLANSGKHGGTLDLEEQIETRVSEREMLHASLCSQVCLDSIFKSGTDHRLREFLSFFGLEFISNSWSNKIQHGVLPCILLAKKILDAECEFEPRYSLA